MRRSSLLSILLLIGITTSLATEPNSTFTLEVEAQGAQPKVGQAIFSLFDSKESFLKEPAVSRIQQINERGTVIFRIEGLKVGKYAVSVVYDEDSNGELNTGFLGIPKEKVGMSNNAKGRFGPPSFKDSAFELTKDTRLVITLGKAKD